VKIDFNDRVAVITGAGRGLGRVYALELAKRGAKVVVNDLGGAIDGRDEGTHNPSDEVAGEITAAGGKAVANYDSVATPEGGSNIIKTAVDHFGRVDILINNAGILRDKTFAKLEPEMWQAVQDIHLYGAYNVTQPAFQIMREGGYGRIVFTTSASGLFGNYGQTNYGAAKMGLVGLMNCLKLEGEKQNIKVNTIAPIAATRLSKDFMPGVVMEKAKPEMVSPLVLYLCSDACRDTGLILNAGGGFYNRVVLVSGEGISLAKDGSIHTLEDIRDNWAEITKIGDQVFKNVTEAILCMMGSTLAETDHLD